MDVLIGVLIPVFHTKKPRGNQNMERLNLKGTAHAELDLEAKYPIQLSESGEQNRVLRDQSSSPLILLDFHRNQRLREVLCWTRSPVPVHLITSVFICSGFFNKMPQSCSL